MALVRHAAPRLTPLLLLSAIVSGLRELLVLYTRFPASAPGRVTLWVLGTSIKAFLLGACTLILADLYLGRSRSFMAAAAAAAARLISFYAISIGLYVVIILGLALLFIPGLAALQRFGLAPTILLLEARSIPEALRRSTQLSLSQGRRLLEAYVVFYGLYGLALLAVLFLLPKLLGSGLLLAATRAGLSLIAFPLLASFRTVLYYDTRVRSEGFDLESRAEAAV